MVQTLNNILNYVADNFLFIFAIYSILFFILYHFRSDKETLKSFDKTAIKVMTWVGTLWILLKIVAIIILIIQARIEDRTGVFSQELSWFIGKVWVQLLFWLILSQLLRIKLVHSYLIPRIIIAFFFAFSFERITLLTTNFHRDYLPSAVNLHIPIWELIPILMLKTLIFTLIIAAIHFLKRFIHEDE